MKKAALLTIYTNSNFGNKLQNYAIQEYLKKFFQIQTVTIRYKKTKKLKDVIKYYIKYLIYKFNNNYILIFGKKNKSRNSIFLDFDEYIIKSDRIENYNRPNFSKLSQEYDYYIVGSDQVWNPTFYENSGVINPLFLLDYVDDSTKKIALSASIGVSDISERAARSAKKSLESFFAISVREYSSKKIVEQITNRNDVKVLIDPTMLIDVKDWELLAKKPKCFSQFNLKKKKFVLKYILGKISDEENNNIEQFARENNLSVVDIYNYDSPFYECGPLEFLWLEKNAYFICTDSFHSAVFGIMFKTPFLVFKRYANSESENMNSRLDTLMKMFKLGNRYSNASHINVDDFQLNSREIDAILNEERNKTYNYLKYAFACDEKKKRKNRND